MRAQLVREKPRISVNKLAEYIVARPSRQRTILQQAKRPPDYITPVYTRVFELIADHFCSGRSDSAVLGDAAQRLHAAVPSTNWQAARNRNCAEALIAFADHLDAIDLTSYTPTRGASQAEVLAVAGVEISVRPEVLLEGARRGRPTHGALKICIAKQTPLRRESAEYAATLVQRYVEQRDGGADYRSCFVLDVFGRTLYSAPQGFRRQMEDIEAACEQISRCWPWA